MLFKKKPPPPRDDLVWIEPEPGPEEALGPGRLRDELTPVLGELRPSPLAALARGEAVPSPSKAVIGAGMRVEGDIDLPGELTVEGRIAGRITVVRLVVAPNGTVIGEVAAEEALLNGTVQGKVAARRVHLSASARVTADLVCHILQVDAGAVFEGCCRRQDTHPPQQAQLASSSS